jgi:nucleotide-binding universal stress UspA family protein
MPTTHALPAGAAATRTDSTPPTEIIDTTDRPIIVATDGSASADPAFIAARLLAHRCGCPVEVLAVTEAALVHLPSAFELPPVPDLDVVRMTALRDRARAQLATMVGDDTGWPIETRFGEAAPTIQRVAHERRAGLVVTGLSRHGVLDRIYGEETNAFIIQVSTVPVLAAAGGTDRLPRSILVAIDPHTAALPPSVHIATLLSDVTTAHFVCVAPETMEMGRVLPAPPWEPSYTTDVEAAYERMRASLQLPATASTKLEMLVGNAPKEIVRIASELKADLIVVGHRRRSVIWRWFDKGLATRLVRASPCSVLVIPRPPHRLAEGHATGRTDILVDPKEWPTRFAELSRRNAGRHVVLELDNTELGAGAQVMNYPFMGIDYDRADDRITIMLGDALGGAAHLTHSIVRPIAVEILEGRSGRTRVIRIEEANGHVLLMFML